MHHSRARSLGTPRGDRGITQDAPTPTRAIEAGPAEDGVEASIVCLLTTLHPERALSRALVQHLVQEMPDIMFTLRPLSTVAVIWVCGYEPGAGRVIRRLRGENPGALIVVTGREPTKWQHEVLEAGADYACGWPIPYSRLNRLFHKRRTSSLS